MTPTSQPILADPDLSTLQPYLIYKYPTLNLNVYKYYIEQAIQYLIKLDKHYPLSIIHDNNTTPFKDLLPTYLTVFKEQPLPLSLRRLHYVTHYLYHVSTHLSDQRPTMDQWGHSLSLPHKEHPLIAIQPTLVKYSIQNVYKAFNSL